MMIYEFSLRTNASLDAQTGIHERRMGVPNIGIRAGQGHLNNRNTVNGSRQSDGST